MKIVIVGDGKVGFTLAEHLSQEHHDVTIIDTNDDALKRASDALDVMCVKGNGATISALRESGADHADVIIADEAQFFSPEQIDQLRRIVDEQNIPVLCFGLRTDFLTHFFPGARRLMELADSITEIKTVCACGRKATVNARIDGNGRVITEGGQILLGGNDSYVAMCHKCWVDKIRAQKEAEKK